MPYPVVHVLFFVFFMSAIAVYAAVWSFLKKEHSREFSSRDIIQLALLLLIGSFCALLPDSMFVYNMLQYGSIEHCWIGPVPTHSFIFSVTAVLFGLFTGFIIYRGVGKALYMSLFAEAAFFSHLLLDDIGEGGCHYLYPLYNEKISIFSMMDITFREAGFINYLVISFASVFFISFVMAMLLISLNQFGFEFRYKSESQLEK